MSKTSRPDGRWDAEITVIAMMTAALGRHEELAAELAALIGPTRMEPGCRRYELSIESEPPERFILTERWRSERDLADHRTEPHLLAFRERASRLLDGPVEIIIGRPLRG